MVMVQAMLPSKVLEIDALRLLLRPFWDRSTPVVASYMAGQVLRIQFTVFAVYMHLLSTMPSFLARILMQWRLNITWSITFVLQHSGHKWILWLPFRNNVLLHSPRMPLKSNSGEHWVLRSYVNRTKQHIPRLFIVSSPDPTLSQGVNTRPGFQCIFRCHVTALRSLLL